MIGRIRCLNGCLVPETLAGPRAGSVEIQEYCGNIDRNVTMTGAVSEGEAWVGISCECPITYNPQTGTLTVDTVNAQHYCNLELTPSCIKYEEACSNIDYEVPFAVKCVEGTAPDTVDVMCLKNSTIPMTYNPYSGAFGARTVNTCTVQKVGSNAKIDLATNDVVTTKVHKENAGVSCDTCLTVQSGYVGTCYTSGNTSGALEFAGCNELCAHFNNGTNRSCLTLSTTCFEVKHGTSLGYSNCFTSNANGLSYNFGDTSCINVGCDGIDLFTCTGEMYFKTPSGIPICFDVGVGNNKSCICHGDTEWCFDTTSRSGAVVHCGVLYASSSNVCLYAWDNNSHESCIDLCSNRVNLISCQGQVNIEADCGINLCGSDVTVGGKLFVCDGIRAYKGEHAANTNVAGFRFGSSTTGAGYYSGAYVGHCNANHDDYWGYATFGFYNAENNTLCPGICVDRLGCSFFSNSVDVGGYLRALNHVSTRRNGGSWGEAVPVFLQDTTLTLGDLWYPLLGQCVCNGSYQFQLGWYGCLPDEWRIVEQKDGHEWRFKGNDGSLVSNIICTRTICFL